MTLTQAGDATLIERLKALDVPFVEELSAYTVASEFVSVIPISFARQHAIMGYSGGEGRMIVALGDPAKWQELDVVSRFLEMPVSPLLAPRAAVIAAINDAYQQRAGQAQAFIETMDRS